MSSEPIDTAAIVAGIREQTRFELTLLHERVNTLLTSGRHSSPSHTPRP